MTVTLVVLIAAAVAMSTRALRANMRSTDPILYAASSHGVTDIAIGSEILQTRTERFGINLSGQSFYDSGMMLRNLVARNPGFEGETWQSNLHCERASSKTCADLGAQWPTGFLDGAQFEVLSGPANGSHGTVVRSVSLNGHGITVTLDHAVDGLSAGNFLQLRMLKPGSAESGWWTSGSAGASVRTEFNDLSPATEGKQALQIDAPGAGQYLNLSSFIDTTAGRSFLQLHGTYTLQFRAKLISGNPVLPVSFERAGGANAKHSFFAKQVPLRASWQDFSYEFVANEDGHATGDLGLNFSVQNGSILIDDVELLQSSADDNPTAFRDEVVASLRALHPGVIRFMDNGTSFGSDLDDLIAPPLARHRGGSQYFANSQADIPIGIHESLALAKAVHADPWYTLPGTTSPSEATHLMEYLGGPRSTFYGGKRVGRGQTAPWTGVFHTIHLEFGNEMWNRGSFGGSTIDDASVYANRANAIFAAIRSSPYFKASGFDLILGAQAENPWLTKQELKSSTQHDSIAFAPYLFTNFNDASSDEAIFGSLFAEPEQEDMSGVMQQQVAATRSAPTLTRAAVYEVNLGTSNGSSKISQADLNRTVPSIGAAIAVADHMLLMLRLGIRTQCLFALPEYANRFTEPGDTSKTAPLWGAVVDMGGATNRKRPSFYALALMNRAILDQLVATRLSGEDPVWDQPASSNDSLPASRAHVLQSFAFRDGKRHSLILLNLSRTVSLPVTFSGPGQPENTVTESRLMSSLITDSNEIESKVTPATRSLKEFNPRIPYNLPAFSMTVLEWQAAS